MLHVKRLAPLLASLLAACPSSSPPAPSPPPPQPTPVVVARPDATSSPSVDVAVPLPSTPSVDWGAAYPNIALTDTEVSSWLSATQSTDALVARHAAFVLGRRVPTTRLVSIVPQIPPSVRDAFARGGAGRAGDLQRGSFPAPLGELFTRAHLDLPAATWVFRAKADAPGMTDPLVRRFLASNRSDDQIGGARLLAATNVTAPYNLVDYLSPVAATLAFRALATKPATPPDAWVRWVTSVALRAQANPRAWGNTWLALAESAPKTQAEVHTALLNSLTALREVDLGDPRTTADFRCTNAAARDLLAGAIEGIPTCAPEALRWRSLIALARYAKDGTTATDRMTALQTAWRGANGDARVLAALTEALVAFPPAVARPMLVELAANRDPGVLAALLDALALHVQHARALPANLRDRLLRAPFELDEAPSLEARLNAIQLARALNAPLPTSTSAVRAVQQALQPDAQVPPATNDASAVLDAGDLVITTNVGRVVIRVDARSARQAAHVVVEAARSGRYNGTVFHRVVPSFVAQGGDPRGDGYGGTSTIVPTELSGEPFERGAVGIALAGLDTGGMQFFIVTADSPHLDARYPWIGRVVEGMEVVDELMAGDVMQRVEFVPR